eukprot:1937418-Prymnesium_polylepis.1
MSLSMSNSLPSWARRDTPRVSVRHTGSAGADLLLTSSAEVPLRQRVVALWRELPPWPLVLRSYTLGCGFALMAFGIYFSVIGFQYIESQLGERGACGSPTDNKTSLCQSDSHTITLSCEQSMEVGFAALVGAGELAT